MQSWAYSYFILTGFPRQQWLRERVLVLWYTHIACLVSFLRNTFTYQISLSYMSVVSEYRKCQLRRCCERQIRPWSARNLGSRNDVGGPLQGVHAGYCLKMISEETTSQTCHLEGDGTGAVLNRVQLIGTALCNVNADVVSSSCNALQRSGGFRFESLPGHNLTDFYDILQSSRLMPK
jgi:hypothetical protein